MKNKVLMLLAICLAVLTLNAATFTVDTAHSHVGFKVRHMMVSNVSGSFSGFSGEVGYDEKSKKLLSVEGDVKTATVDTGNKKRDGHLVGTDFFDAAKYPDISFHMTKVKRDKVYGKLTIKGVTKNVAFNYEFGGVVKDPWGNERLGMTLSGKIDRTEFGLKYNSVLDNGGVSIGNEVKIVVELEAIKAK